MKVLYVSNVDILKLISSLHRLICAEPLYIRLMIHNISKKKKKKKKTGQESSSASHKLLCCLLLVQIGAEHGGQFHRHDSIIFCFYRKQRCSLSSRKGALFVTSAHTLQPALSNTFFQRIL